MKKIFYILLLCVPAKLTQTDQSKDIEELTKVAKQQQQTIDLLTHLLLQQQQKHIQQEQAYVEAQKQEEENWDKKNWLEKSGVVTLRLGQQILFHYIIPAMISDLTHRVAGEANHHALFVVDRVTGDAVDYASKRLFGQDWGCRPGERLYLSPEGREFAAVKRQADPETQQLLREVLQLRAQQRPATMQETFKKELREEREERTAVWQAYQEEQKQRKQQAEVQAAL